jgi:DNA polymerase III delta prime subunit
MATDVRKSYSLWTERYRPQKISEMILPKSMKSYFTRLVTDGDIPNLLLHSANPGSGKTSIAHSLVSEIGADSIYINASLESNIDTIRDTIVGFASCASFSDKKKIVILDEACGILPNSQKALRGVIEKFHNICRFIFTANYLTQIIEPLQSRCVLVDFNFTEQKIKDEMIPKIYKGFEAILKAEKIEFDPDTLQKLIVKYYCDLRKVTNVLQQFSKERGIVDGGVLSYDCVSTELIDLLLAKKFTKARELIINNNYNIQGIYSFLYHNLIPKIDKDNQAQVTILIAQYEYQSHLSTDKEIQLSALLLELMGVI